MIIPRQKSFSFFGLFGNSNNKTENKAEKQQIENLIKDRYGWALSYIDGIDDQLVKENKKLGQIDNSGEIPFCIPPIGNDICSLADCIAFFDSSKYWVAQLKPMYIKYSPEDDKLFLRKGYAIAWGFDHSKDPIILEIKNLADLKKACKMYFQELKDTLKKTTLDTFEFYCTGDDEDLLDYIGKDTIKSYYNELSRFLNTIRI